MQILSVNSFMQVNSFINTRLFVLDVFFFFKIRKKDPSWLNDKLNVYLFKVIDSVVRASFSSVTRLSPELQQKWFNYFV